MTSAQPGNLYLLRHEQRGNDVSFGADLTMTGYTNAQNLLRPQLESLNIDVIYSSPFVRTLQTVRPFCDKSNLKVNLEWSLAEPLPMQVLIPSYFGSMINCHYVPRILYITPDNTQIFEFAKLKQRVDLFMCYLDRSKNILLVTHMPVINAILSYEGVQNIDMHTHHEFGALLSVKGNW